MKEITTHRIPRQNQTDCPHYLVKIGTEQIGEIVKCRSRWEAYSLKDGRFLGTARTLKAASHLFRNTSR